MTSITLTPKDRQTIVQALELYIRENGCYSLMAGAMDKDKAAAKEYDEKAINARTVLDKLKLVF